MWLEIVHHSSVRQSRVIRGRCMVDEGGSAGVPPKAVYTSSLLGEGESEAIESATFVTADGIRDPDIAAIMSSKAEFICPEGYERYPITKQNESRSPMYTYGVRVISTAPIISPGETVWGRYYCMFSKECRVSKTCIKISNKNTSPATNHLADVHGIRSSRVTKIVRT